MRLMELGGSHTAPWLLHRDSSGTALLYSLHPICNTLCPIGLCHLLLGPPCRGGSWGRSRWDFCAAISLMTLSGSIPQWGTSSAPEQVPGAPKGATASPEGWWRQDTEAVSTAGHQHPPKVKTPGDLPAGSPVTQGSGPILGFPFLFGFC